MTRSVLFLLAIIAIVLAISGCKHQEAAAGSAVTPVTSPLPAPAGSTPTPADNGDIKSEQQASFTNLRMLCVSGTVAAVDNKECLPVIRTPEDIKSVLHVDDKYCYQPYGKLPYLPNASLAGKYLGDIQYQKQLVYFFEQTPYPDGSRMVVYVDGTVEQVTAAGWEQVKAKSGI